LKRHNSNNILGIIPARGGSKGVPKKNIRKINGKPLIYYTIAESQKSKLLTDFVVSTESKEIAEYCKSIGHEIPFMRPLALSEDHVESYPVIYHALKEMEKIKKIYYDIIVMLQPTTPLRIFSDIDNALAMLLESDAESIVSIVNVGGYHPLRMKQISDNNILVNYVEQKFENMQPRQSLPPVFIRNGAIYASKRNIIINKMIVGRSCLAYEMPYERSVNIDTEIDFNLAELMMKK